jgi:hypothetical protein
VVHRSGATLTVVVLPVAVVWMLRATGVITSLWVGMALAVALTLLATAAGNAYWKRRRKAGDVVFGDLLPWGWFRRRRAERRLANTLEQLRDLDARDTPERTQLLQQIAAGLDVRYPYLDGHSHRVARYSSITAERMHLRAEQVTRIGTAASIHDVGKLHVSREILDKPERLTEEEFEQIKRHAAEGARMVACLGDPEVTAIVRHHHERFDGRGYPDGLRGEDIPLGSRILGVTDTFDAITAERPYRSAAKHKRALDILAAEAGRQFDPAVVGAFLGYYTSRRGLALWGLLASPVGHKQASSGVAVPIGVVLALLAATALVFPVSREVAQPNPEQPTASAAASAASSASPQSAPARPSLAKPSPARSSPAKRRTSPSSSRWSGPASAATIAATTPSARSEAPSAATDSRPQHAPSSPAAGPPVAKPPAGKPPAGKPPAGRPPAEKPPGAKPPAGKPPVAGEPRPDASPTPGPPSAPTPSSTTPQTAESVAAPPPVGVPSAPPGPTSTPSTSTPTKDDCKHGGYTEFGYSNQGRCISGNPGPGR